MFRRPLMPMLALFAFLTACIAHPAVAPTVTRVPATKQPATPTIAATGTKTPGCSVVSLQPTPGPTEQSLFPASRQGDQASGPVTATVTIIEYGDFQ
jgi:hypothetical protein